jgi:hypothetical protein
VVIVNNTAVNISEQVSLLYADLDCFGFIFRRGVLSNDPIDQVDLTDIYRIFHPIHEYTFFSAAYGTFSKIDLILGHKSNGIKLVTIRETKKYTNNEEHAIHF